MSLNRDQLILQHMKLVYKVISDVLGSSRRPVWIGKEDLLQDGRLALIKAAKKFDPDRGFKFSTYAYKSIKNAIIKSAFSQTRIDECNHQCLSLEDSVCDDEASLEEAVEDINAQNNFEDTVAYRTCENELQRIVDREKSLNDEDKEFLLESSCYTASEIAKRHSVDKQYVNKRLFSIKRIINKRYKKELYSLFKTA